VTRFPPHYPQNFGKYILLRSLAVGGMAEIFLAIEHLEGSARRFVTIKRIRSEYANDDDYIEFFLNEARVSLSLSHPNLPHTFELGVADGYHYLAMEFIRGHTLLDVVRASAKQHSPISVASAVRIGAETAAALECLHTLKDVNGEPMRIIHRDVTPQNIMISRFGSVKLIDFGVVRSAVQRHRTRSGIVKGKFSYLAPEMLIPEHGFDQRADLFALGIVLHETLTARPLFRASNEVRTVERLRESLIPTLSAVRKDVPEPVSLLVHKLLNRNPHERFQNATDVLRALEMTAAQCNIHGSVTGLRDEVHARCGVPPLPNVTDEDLAHKPQSGKGPCSSRDRELAYFLDLSSGVSIPQMQDRFTPHEEADLAALLARIDEKFPS